MKNKKNIDRLISRAINETMSEKADELVKSLNELGGMTPDSQDTEHPFYNLGPNASRKEINRIMKDYYGKEDYISGDDEDENEIGSEMSRNTMAKMKDDESDDWNEIDIEGMGDEKNYEEMEEGFDDYEMKGWRGGKDYSEKEFEKIPLGQGKVGFPSEEDFDDETGSSMERFIKKRFKGYRDEDDEEGYELTEGEVCECGGDMKEGECMECGKSWMEEGSIITTRSNVRNSKPPVTDLEEDDLVPTRSNIKTNMTNDEEFMENIYDVEDLGDSEFDYIESEEENDYEDNSSVSMKDEYIKRTKEACDPNSINYNKESCEYHKNNFDGGELSEKLYGNQHKLDHNKNGRIDADDLRKARMKGKHKKGGETDEQWQGALLGAAEAALPYVVPAATEWALDKAFGGENNESVEKRKKGKKFPDLSGDGKVTRKDILMGRGVKFGKGKKKIKESIKFSEKEIIDLIENIVLEEKSNLKKGVKHKGTTTYEKAHKGSGKENEDYIKSVTKKMKDYLKDGSKGGFDMNPKMFPKGNGELAKMSKKAYKPSQAIQDYTDNLTAAGLENLDYDEIHPNEDWVNDLMVGSSKTGNNPEWANAVDTGVNKKRRKVQKDNLLAKIKRKAYNKSPQPIISDKTGEDSGVNKLMTKLESIESKKTEKLNEEFDRMKELLGYNRKTQ